MVDSRYSRLNPQVQQDLVSSADPSTRTTLQFSNSIPQPNSHSRLVSPQHSSSASSNSSSKRGPQATAYSVSGAGSNDGIAYTGFQSTIAYEKPKNSRTRTSSSLFKVASSIWSAGRNLSISHFRIPSVAAPWEHEISEKYASSLGDGSGPGAPQSGPPSETIRYFDHHRQRRRVFLNSLVKFLITLFFAAALFGTIYGFATLKTGMTSTRKRFYNALVTGISLCLGLNVVSSFKAFAQMMRWRFLASGYRPLQDFELVLNCDSQSQVFRLLWAGRTRGRWWPNKVQSLAFFWLLLNVAVQVFIALLGLTYSIDVSDEFVMLDYGLVSVANLTFIGDETTSEQYATSSNESAYSLLAQFANANVWGMTGQDYQLETIAFNEYTGGEQRIYTDPDDTLFWYRFIDRSPNKYSDAAATGRTVNTTASCKSYDVVFGGYGGFNTLNESLQSLVTWVDDDGINVTFSIPEVATGATTWMANVSSDCGDRCLQLYALQTATNETGDVPFPRFWKCFSNVSTVDGIDGYPVYEGEDPYTLPDIQAQILAGAIGWSGVITSYDTEGLDIDDLQRVRYPLDSQWSPPGNVTEREMARLVEKFTAGAISALDMNGPRITVNGFAPGPAQIVKVTWSRAALILAGVPLIHFLVMLAVISFANKAIIKDGSYLSTARLLRPIVDKLGDNGCLLTGDEIAETLGNFRVIYGVRDPGVGNVPAFGAGDDGGIRHVDVLKESEGLGYRRGRMPVGRYDGLSGKDQDQERVGLLSESPQAGMDLP